MCTKVSPVPAPSPIQAAASSPRQGWGRAALGRGGGGGGGVGRGPRGPQRSLEVGAAQRALGVAARPEPRVLSHNGHIIRTHSRPRMAPAQRVRAMILRTRGIHSTRVEHSPDSGGGTGGGTACSAGRAEHGADTHQTAAVVPAGGTACSAGRAEHGAGTHQTAAVVPAAALPAAQGGLSMAQADTHQTAAVVPAAELPAAQGGLSMGADRTLTRQRRCGGGTGGGTACSAGRAEHGADRHSPDSGGGTGGGTACSAGRAEHGAGTHQTAAVVPAAALPAAQGGLSMAQTLTRQRRWYRRRHCLQRREGLSMAQALTRQRRWYRRRHCLQRREAEHGADRHSPDSGGGTGGGTACSAGRAEHGAGTHQTAAVVPAAALPAAQGGLSMAQGITRQRRWYRRRHCLQRREG
ncbi:hypothetical protein ACJJTC_005812 [Scirpophaga incertulas]